MASDSRRDCVGTFVPPPALLCQTRFLFPVRGFAVLITSLAPTPGLSSFQPPHHLLLLPAFCFCFFNWSDSGLRYHQVRWDTSHRLFMREQAHVPLGQLSSGDILGLSGATKPGPPQWPGAAVTLFVTQGHTARLPCRPGAPPAPRCRRRPTCGGPAPPPLNPERAAGQLAAADGDKGAHGLATAGVLL